MQDSLPLITINNRIRTNPLNRNFIFNPDMKYSNIHLLTDENINKDIKKLTKENQLRKTFLQMYTHNKIDKPSEEKKCHFGQTTLSTFNPNKTNYTLSTAYKNTINTSYSIDNHNVNKGANDDTINNFDQNNTSILKTRTNQVQSPKEKEFDIIFKNSIKMLQKIKKEKKTTKKFTPNKYTNNTVNEINEIQNKMSYLSGVINYIYPKIVSLKSHENEKYRKLNQSRGKSVRSKMVNKRNISQIDLRLI